MKNTKLIKQTLGKNIVKAHFSTTLALKADKPDIISRIDELLKKNTEITEKFKVSLHLKKSRDDVDEKLKEEDTKMIAHLKVVTGYLNKDENDQLDKTLKEHVKIAGLTHDKLLELDPEDPDHKEKEMNYLQFLKTSYNKMLDKMDALSVDAVKRDMVDTKASFFETYFYNAARRQRLQERKEVLNTDKELFTRELKECKTSSVVEDYADPNMEQPSYIDPED